MSENADLEIRAGWVLPVHPDPTVSLENHSILIKDDKILDILPTAAAADMYSPATFIDRTSSIVMPGLINAHTHTGMTLMRGRADDLPLLKWLHDVVWPIEGAFASKEEFCEDGAMLAAAEMIRGGITCFSDMYWYPAAAARVTVRTGMRAVIGMVLIEYPSAYAKGVDEYIAKGHDIMQQFQDEDRITFSYAPHAPYTVATETWKKLGELSQKNGVFIHTHLHETREECSASCALDRSHPACHLSENKCHPVEDFRRMGLLSSKLVAAHMVHMTDEEIQLCAEKGVNIAHCPSSNSKLASGFCPVHKFLKAGINVALGTDSACSNNSLSLLEEMKLTALNTKNLAGDATALPAYTAIQMATLNGAKAFGLEDVTGSLEVGKAADIISIDVHTHAGNSPMFDAHSAVVYAAAREDVNDVMVNGKFLLKEGKHCTVDIGDTLKRMRHWRSKIMEEFPQK